METTIQPLRNHWKVDEDSAVPAEEQILQRVNSESWYTCCKGYPNIKVEDIKVKKKNANRSI